MMALVDCNSCYASCEQVFRPDLRDKPVVVLSNNDGCIIARSKQAKQLGIPDLQPYFKQKSLLDKHNVDVFSANFRLYGDISNQVMDNLRDFSPRVEQYSIDEMFLDIAHMPFDLHEYAEQIKQQIWRHVRMPVGVGVAPSKTLAKLANHAAKHIKKDGVAVLDTPEKWQWLEKRLPIQKIWGIGSRLTRRLNDIGIRSVYELAQADPKWVRRFTSVNVEKTIEELNGIACITLDEVPLAKKEIFVTRTFAHKTDSLAELQKHISRYASAAAEKLRSQDSYCQSIYVFVNTSQHKANYYANSIVLQMPYPTSDTSLISRFVKSGIRLIFEPGHRYMKCGIGLLDLRDRSFYQSDLFLPEQSAKSDRLMQTLDRINRRFGRDTVAYAAEGITGRWTMQQNRLSPSYTSSWSELPIIACRN